MKKILRSVSKRKIFTIPLLAGLAAILTYLNISPEGFLKFTRKTIGLLNMKLPIWALGILLVTIGAFICLAIVVQRRSRWEEEDIQGWAIYHQNLSPFSELQEVAEYKYNDLLWPVFGEENVFPFDVSQQRFSHISIGKARCKTCKCEMEEKDRTTVLGRYRLLCPMCGFIKKSKDKPWETQERIEKILKASVRQKNKDIF